MSNVTTESLAEAIRFHKAFKSRLHRCSERCADDIAVMMVRHYCPTEVQNMVLLTSGSTRTEWSDAGM